MPYDPTIDRAAELVAQDAIGQAVKLLAGMSAPKRRAVIETLRLATGLDPDDMRRVRDWLNSPACAAEIALNWKANCYWPAECLRIGACKYPLRHGPEGSEPSPEKIRTSR